MKATALLFALAFLPLAAHAAAVKPAGKPSSFSGRFWGKDAQGTMHMWDFAPDGTCYHTRIIGSNRSGERCVFEVKDGEMTVKIKSHATAFSAQTVGGRGTAIGGGADSKEETRRMKFKQLGGKDGIELDGLKLKPKSW